MFGAVGGFIGQNLMMIIGVITGGAALSSVRYIREYERGVVTRFGKLVRLPDPPPNSDGVKEYSGFVFRIPGLYRVEVVNIRDRTDMLSVDGIERPDKARGGTAKWRMATLPYTKPVASACSMKTTPYSRICSNVSMVSHTK